MNGRIDGELRITGVSGCLVCDMGSDWESNVANISSIFRSRSPAHTGSAIRRAAISPARHRPLRGAARCGPERAARRKARARLLRGGTRARGAGVARRVLAGNYRGGAARRSVSTRHSRGTVSRSGRIRLGCIS